MMNKDTVVRSVMQGDDLHLTIEVKKEVSDKMGEIARRYPEGTWTYRGLDLLKMANEELEQGKEIYSPSQQSQQKEK